MSEAVLVTRDGSVATVLLDRPRRRNASTTRPRPPAARATGEITPSTSNNSNGWHIG